MGQVTDRPTSLEIAIVEAIIVHSGGVCLSADLADAIKDVNARGRAGLPVSLAEHEWIDRELATSPGYAAWKARQLLDRALQKAVA
jgi:hypothetical protein